MEDVVVDCDVVGHTMNRGAGNAHRAATLFISALLESETAICIDADGFVMTEYEALGITRTTNPLVKSFIRHLISPGRQCIVSDGCLTHAQRQAIGHLNIDQHDKRYVRIAACATERWLVSNDGTYNGREADVHAAGGVIVEHSSEGVLRF